MELPSHQMNQQNKSMVIVIIGPCFKIKNTLLWCKGIHKRLLNRGYLNSGNMSVILSIYLNKGHSLEWANFGEFLEIQFLDILICLLPLSWKDWSNIYCLFFLL